MLFDVGDVRTHNGKCQIVVQVERAIKEEGKSEEIKVVWRDVIKNFLETHMVKIEGDLQKAIELFKNEEFSEDDILVYRLEKGR